MEKTWYINCPHCQQVFLVKITSEGKAIPEVVNDKGKAVDDKKN